MSLFMKMAQIENCQNPWMDTRILQMQQCTALVCFTTFFLEGIANDFSQVADSVFVF